jgi:hypothetical protein
MVRQSQHNTLPTAAQDAPMEILIYVLRHGQPIAATLKWPIGTALYSHVFYSESALATSVFEKRSVAFTLPSCVGSFVVSGVLCCVPVLD